MHPGPSLKTRREHPGLTLIFDGGHWRVKTEGDEMLLGKVVIREVAVRYDKTETGQYAAQLEGSFYIPAGANIRGDGSFQRGTVTSVAINGVAQTLLASGGGDMCWGTERQICRNPRRTPCKHTGYRNP